jgi:hypothetical protein
VELFIHFNEFLVQLSAAHTSLFELAL